ncbi:hypothetical protein BDW_06650 [Bdellovibrio bacteriovorus W]|nr:hypothetical protein BDW_06650 [Bdellovibrio bacteriovorus W]
MKIQTLLLSLAAAFVLGACSHSGHKHGSCCASKVEKKACDGKECSMERKCSSCGDEKKAEAAK